MVQVNNKSYSSHFNRFDTLYLSASLSELEQNSKSAEFKMLNMPHSPNFPPSTYYEKVENEKKIG